MVIKLSETFIIQQKYILADHILQKTSMRKFIPPPKSPNTKLPSISKPSSINYFESQSKKSSRQQVQGSKQLSTPKNQFSLQNLKVVNEMESEVSSSKYQNRKKLESAGLAKIHKKSNERERGSSKSNELEESAEKKTYQKNASGVTSFNSHKNSETNLHNNRPRNSANNRNKQKYPQVSKNINLNGILDKIINLEKSRAFIAKQRHLSLNTNKNPEKTPEKLTSRPSLPTNDKLLNIKINPSLAQHHSTQDQISNLEDEIIFPEHKRGNKLYKDGDKTLEDFQKNIQKNREYIHGEISKNMSQKRNKYGNRNKTESSYIVNSECKADKLNLLEKNINKIKSYKKYAISDEDYRVVSSSRKNDQKMRHNSGQIKHSDIKQLQNKNKEKKKIQSQNKNFQPEQQALSLCQSSVFGDINRIIIQKLSKNDENKLHQILESSHFSKQNKDVHLKKLKQTNKLEKLIQKIKSFSPEKSHLEIEKQIAMELHHEFGIHHRARVSTEHRDNPIHEKYKLKNQNNYSDWRRVSLNSKEKEEMRRDKLLNGRSLNLQDVNSSNEVDFLNISVQYTKSNFEIENSRLEGYVLKNQNTLASYFNAHKELMSYQQKINDLKEESR